MPRKKTKPTTLPTNQIDGKDHALERQPTTIDEVLGVARYSPYTTFYEDEYLAGLTQLVKIDLQRECIRVGLLPHDNEELMKQRLVKEFRKYIANFNTAGLSPNILESNTKAAEDIMKRCIFGG